jgi:hypothetical protein
MYEGIGHATRRSHGDVKAEYLSYILRARPVLCAAYALCFVCSFHPLHYLYLMLRVQDNLLNNL